MAEEQLPAEVVAAAEPAAETPKSKLKWIIIAVAVLAIAGGGAAFFLRKPAATPEKKKPAGKEARVKSVLHLESFVINLADPEQKAYLRIGIDLGLGAETKTKEGEGGAQPVSLVRDVIVGVLSVRQTEELLTPEGKEKLKADLLAALRKRAPELGVEEVYSTSQVDQRKVGKLAMAIQVAFQELGVFPASTSAVPMNSADPMPFNTVQAIERAERTAALGRIVPPAKGVLGTGDAHAGLSSLQKELEEALAPEIKRKEVALRVQHEGLVVSLREVGFFDSGSAEIRADSLAAFTRMAELLAAREYFIRIEGHTDNLPIHNAQFASNWELSTARATEMVRLLVTTYEFAPQRLSAAGYAEYHPVSPNTSPEGRAQNRRVDVVVLGKEPEESAEP